MPGNPNATTRRRVLPPGPKADLVAKLTSSYQSMERFPPFLIQSGEEVQNGSALGTFSGTQVTESEGHPFHSVKSTKGDLGGEFFTTRSFLEGPISRISETVDNGIVLQPGLTHRSTHHQGPIMPWFPTSGGLGAFPASAHSSNATIDQLGATAIARCAPGNPPADVATFLGELLHDGLPSLVGSHSWKDRTHAAKAAKAAGSDYLNLAFGWLPMVSDMKSLASAIVHADKVLTQLERDAGKVVRRRYRFPIERDVQEQIIAINQRAFTFFTVDGTYTDAPPSGVVVRRRETVRERWFSGAFTYYLPSGYDSRNQIARLASKSQALLGLALTPDTVWELTPWSWAVDWFSNAGDVIHNATRFATGGLVMRYGYMMERSIVKDTYTISNTGLTRYAHIEPLVLVTETKLRRQANPFGFGLSWEGLSTFQQSILAALGITRFGR